MRHWRACWHQQSLGSLPAFSRRAMKTQNSGATLVAQPKPTLHLKHVGHVTALTPWFCPKKRGWCDQFEEKWYNGNRGSSSDIKPTFLREPFYSFCQDLFPSSSDFVQKNSTTAGKKIPVCNLQDLDFIFCIFPTNHNPFACKNYSENFNFLPCLFLPMF